MCEKQEKLESHLAALCLVFFPKAERKSAVGKLSSQLEEQEDVSRCVIRVNSCIEGAY